MTTAWLDHIRLVGRLRVAERRGVWRAGGAVGVHGDVDDVLGGRPTASPPPAIEESWQAVVSDPAWARLAGLGLDRQEQELLALLAAAHADPRLGRVLGYLDDDAQPGRVTIAAASTFFGWPAGVRPGPAGGLVTWALAEPDEGYAHPWQSGTPWLVDPDIVALLSGAPDWAAFWPGLEHVVGAGRICLDPELADAIAERIAKLPGGLEIEVVGRPGSGRRTLIRAVCARLEREALIITHPRIARRALRTARLLGAVPVWIADGLEQPPMLDNEGPTFVARTSPDRAADGLRLSYPVPETLRGDRLRLWDALTGAPVPAAVDAWALTPGEIVTAAAAAPAGPRAVSAVLRGRLGTVSSSLVSPLVCPYAWDDLVVAPGIERQLRELESQVRLAGAVLDDWGLRRLTPTGRGTAALFAGPSGTGKTMAAQVLARELDVDLFRVDLAEVVNKYIGETEKRLAQVFDECERSNVMILFDEADALFGQRTQVRDAHDRFANIEVDYLLQRMETFDGVAILATNRKGDLDSAFVRRLRVIVDFLPPGPAERLALWQLALPERAADGTRLIAPSTTPTGRRPHVDGSRDQGDRPHGRVRGACARRSDRARRYARRRPPRGRQARRRHPRGADGSRQRTRDPRGTRCAVIDVDRLALHVGAMSEAEAERLGRAVAEALRRWEPPERPIDLAQVKVDVEARRAPDGPPEPLARQIARRRDGRRTAGGRPMTYMRGALIEFMETVLIPIPNVIVFQFNPETMTHTWTQSEAAQRVRRAEPARGQGSAGGAVQLQRSRRRARLDRRRRRLRRPGRDQRRLHPAGRARDAAVPDRRRRRAA